MGVAHLLGEEGAEPGVVDVGPRKPLLAPEQILLYGFRRDQSTRAERAASNEQLDVVEYEEVAAAPAASGGRHSSASRHGAGGCLSISTST